MVSIIITTRNEEQVLERLLKSIAKQTYKKIETIVVDNKSADKTVSIAKKYTKNVYDFGPERSAQRNYGAKKAKGEYLLVLDADMELTPTVVEQCLMVIEKDQKIGAVAIPEISVAKTFWERVKAYERSFYNKEGDSTTDAARFFRREAFEKVGGYDETITGPEDWDLPENIKKRGYKTTRITASINHYERVPSPVKLAQKKYYYALTSHRYLKKHDIPVVSAKTIYFLRPVFYKNWPRLVFHPVMAVALFWMFTLELFGGGLGYLVGRFKKL